eukprot:2498175-Amphidinium_carterae.1
MRTIRGVLGDLRIVCLLCTVVVAVVLLHGLWPNRSHTLSCCLAGLQRIARKCAQECAKQHALKMASQ